LNRPLTLLAIEQGQLEMPHGEKSLDKSIETTCARLQDSDILANDLNRLLIEQVKRELEAGRRSMLAALKQHDKLIALLGNLLKTK
jgi:hypothetical protein